MSQVRRALLFTATERFIVVSINFVVLAIVARLLTPEEIGFSVIGATALGIAESFRDFGATGYIVQQTHLTRHGARTAATIMLVLSLVCVVALWSASGQLAAFYHKAGLQAYLHVTALTFLAGPISGPLLALLRREMQFGVVAVINVASSAATAFVTLVLATLGLSSMSFAWGALCGGTTAAILAFVFCHDRWVLRPAIREWRATLAFGLYTSGAGLIGKMTESLPALILGRTLSLDAVGYYNRAAMVCQLPDKCLLTGLLPVALPAMAAEVRAGRGLKAPYLRGLSFITVVQWPAFALLVILAYPAVTLLLGRQWTPIAPLVQIIALGSMMSAPNVLFSPTLIAIGALRDAFWCALIVLPISVSAIGGASFFGVEAVAWSFCICIGSQSVIALLFVRMHCPFTWRDLANAVWKSAVVTAASAALPILTVAALGFRFDLSAGATVLIALEALAGWGVGLMATGHPLFLETHTGLAAMQARRLRNRSPAQIQSKVSAGSSGAR